jgi:NAD(P)-dependent dehydrogenase (short-subunit alcohol dehydrogenase family)
MAMELVKHNILVNAVAPGAIATPMNDMDDSEVKEGSMPEIPLARPGHTKEIASLVAWLCDSDASYTTGQSFIVDGGFMLANPQFKPGVVFHPLPKGEGTKNTLSLWERAG